MPFRYENSGCTFVRFMKKVVAGLESAKVYGDDAMVYTDTWESYVSAIRALFDRKGAHQLTGETMMIPQAISLFNYSV